MAVTNDSTTPKLLPALSKLATWLVPVSAVKVAAPVMFNAVLAACTTPPLAPAPRVVTSQSFDTVVLAIVILPPLTKVRL